jgi:TRAP-type C4-dicarboxylate transport system permease small subunit
MTGFIRFFDSKIIKWFIIGTYTYFCLIILIEVIRRYIFGASSPWGEMTARYAFVYLTYVAAAEGIRQGRHIRIDLLPNRIPPATIKWLEMYIDALTILLAGTVIYYSLELIGILWSAGIVMTAADVNMAFAHAALPLGWILIIIRIVQNWIDRSYGGRTSPDSYGAN